MDTFYTHQSQPLFRNLTKVAKDALSSKEAFAEWASVPQSLPHTVLKIAPAHGYYFLGTLDSLIDQLGAIQGLGRLETTDGSGLCIAMVTGITLSGTKQFGAFFKGKFSGKQSTIDLNKLRQKKLTVVAVYNANTMGLIEPEVPRILNLMNHDLQYATLANHLANMRAAAIRRVQNQREQAVGNLFEQLHVN